MKMKIKMKMKMKMKMKTKMIIKLKIYNFQQMVYHKKEEPVNLLESNMKLQKHYVKMGRFSLVQ